MPTPVAAARQCLTEEAARALEDAVTVARRRSHAQTTSLHALSALLALPSSALRSTCSRLAAAGSRPPRLQLKALEFSVGVFLDRLPTSRSGAGEEDGGGPPLSNSLMAAIRRSQANQRRQPESFYTYSNTASVLKVELKHFIVSILDDPNISRVLWEAGFRSCDIKLAILNPPVSPRRRGSTRPPVFLCNFPGYDVDRSRLGKEDGDDSCKRIVNVLLGKGGKGRNPLLVGVSSSDVVDRFVSLVSGSGGNKEVLFGELVGVGVASLGEVVGDKERTRLKFEEICSELERGTGIGLIVNYGELKGFVAEDDDEAGNCLVAGLKGLLERYQGKVWLIGAATSDEAVSHLVKRFPDIERDLDLHILPVASSSNRFVYSPTSQSSLMRSFVPFGGFFSTPDDLRKPFSISPPITRCHLCTANFEQEVDAMTKAGSKVPVADQHAQKISSWLQMADAESSSREDLTQTVDEEGTMNVEILGLERKWTDTCRRLHHAHQFSVSDAFSVGYPAKVQGIGFPLAKGKPGWIMDSSPNDHPCKELTPGLVIDSSFQPKHIRPVQLVSRGADTSCQVNALEDTSNSQTKGDSTLQDSPFGCRVSSSITSGTTKAASGLLHASSSLEHNFLKKCDNAHHSLRISPSNSVTSDSIGERTSRQIRDSVSCSSLSSADQFDLSLHKTIRRVLAEKVPWQDEAIYRVCEAVSCSRTKRRHNATSTRGNIWLTFLGPDKVGKKRIAFALAEIIGSSKPLVYVDLSSCDRDSPSSLIFGRQDSSDYDMEFVGRTHVDRIAAEVRKNPRAVIFLENIDKADLLVQSSLSQAVRSGKLSDSRGREISIDNMLFLMTMPDSVQKQHPSTDQTGTRYSEEEVLAARRWQMNLSVELLVDGAILHDNAKVRVIGDFKSSKTSSNKRKRDDTKKEMRADARKCSQPAKPAYFDLNNPPAEELEEDTSSGDSYCDPIAKDTEAWLEDFLDQVDQKITFKPFDFDALAEKIMKLISTRFLDVFGSTGRLEITHQAMVQMLAASWSSESDRAAEEWVDKVLARGFAEARYKYRHHLRGRVLVTLAACEGLVMEKQADGICLPSTINLRTN